jgi:hypothetical protein
VDWIPAGALAVIVLVMWGGYLFASRHQRRILDPRYNSPRAVNESIDRARDEKQIESIRRMCADLPAAPKEGDPVDFGAALTRCMCFGCPRRRELETENKRLAFRLRCAESLISVRALRGDLELDAAACDEGMGG